MIVLEGRALAVATASLLRERLKQGGALGYAAAERLATAAVGNYLERAAFDKRNDSAAAAEQRVAHLHPYLSIESAAQRIAELEELSDNRMDLIRKHERKINAMEARALAAEAQLAQVPAQSSTPVAEREVSEDDARAVREALLRDDMGNSFEGLRRTRSALEAFRAARQDRAAQVAGEWSRADVQAASEALAETSSEDTYGDRARAVLHAVRYRLAPTAQGPEGKVLVDSLTWAQSTWLRENEPYPQTILAKFPATVAMHETVDDALQRAKRYAAIVPVRNLDGMDWQLIDDVLANEEPHKAVHIFASMLKKRFAEHRPAPAPTPAKVESVDDVLREMRSLKWMGVEELADRIEAAMKRAPTPFDVAARDALAAQERAESGVLKPKERT